MPDSIVVDSSFTTLAEAVENLAFPEEILSQLQLVTVTYVSFDAKVHQGQLVVHKDCAEEIALIFSELLTIGFPIEKVVPISRYTWDDEKSMQDNNTSAFNYRRIIGTNDVSNHSHGRAIDINPMQNPYYAKDGNTYPSGAVYNPSVPGTLVSEGAAVTLFKKHGWRWLGDREEHTDYQHFDKVSA